MNDLKPHKGLDRLLLIVFLAALNALVAGQMHGSTTQATWGDAEEDAWFGMSPSGPAPERAGKPTYMTRAASKVDSVRLNCFPDKIEVCAKNM
jgi:hypothetical protein